MASTQQLLENRIAWCKSAMLWIRKCPAHLFSDSLPPGVDGRDLHECILFINNLLFDEARDMLLRGQEVVGRWRKHIDDHSFAHMAARKDLGFEDDDEMEQYCCFLPGSSKKLEEARAGGEEARPGG
mmetsp:Transcript_3859/g.9542  ORF Transcript_3859/g.9542 Transcript_3859/m.9542 type:complete len:127 (-) Transcript_3859:1993-2373(-)